MKTLTKKIYI